MRRPSLGGHIANASLRLVLAAISRALWFNKLTLAKNMLRITAIEKDLWYIADGKIQLKDLVCFGDLLNETHRDNLQSEFDGFRIGISCTTSVNQQDQLRSRIAASKRPQGALWPTGRSMIVKGD